MVNTFTIKVPPLGESILQATVGRWLKNIGEAVQADEMLVELETEKVTLEVTAPQAGTLSKILAQQGTTVEIGSVIGEITAEETQQAQEEVLLHQAVVAPAMNSQPEQSERSEADVHCSLEARKPLSTMRLAIAARLKHAQNTAAILTTFNEVDMSAINAVRARYKEGFMQKYSSKLGLMSFFVKAAVAALKEQPTINASIEGTEVVYKHYYDIGVAIAIPQGLVVPVIRNADQLSFADIEKKIEIFSGKAAEGKLTIEELTGGTFTISNGGVFGSLFSTPILNPPQSAILGMHKTQERAVVVEGSIQIRPMMYLALSYDHRLIDGQEAVTFLARIKECIENPMLLAFAL
jgi:2-oxoglutarate dehydrogenase E2 component (dihydrolipoamide succinyltransferase)